MCVIKLLTASAFRPIVYISVLPLSGCLYDSLLWGQEVEAIRGVGKRIADKVVEIMESGELRRLKHVDPKMEVIQLFMGVWGAGPETAKKWYSEVSPRCLHRVWPAWPGNQ